MKKGNKKKKKRGMKGEELRKWTRNKSDNQSMNEAESDRTTDLADNIRV